MNNGQHRPAIPHNCLKLWLYQPIDVMKFFKLVLGRCLRPLVWVRKRKTDSRLGMCRYPAQSRSYPQPVRGPEVVKPSGNTFLVAGKQVIGGVLRCHLVAAKGSDHKQSALNRSE